MSGTRNQLATFYDDGRTGAVPYSLHILEHPQDELRYEVVCVLKGAPGPAWSERFDTLRAASARWIDEFRVMTRDYDLTEAGQ